MSRPQIEIDMSQLAALCRYKPRLEDAAAFFKCSPDTIERRIKEHTASEERPEGLTFAEFRDQNMVQTRFKLVQQAIQRAEGSDTMLIFCLKNLCGWSDKAEITVEQAKPIEFRYALPDSPPQPPSANPSSTEEGAA